MRGEFFLEQMAKRVFSKVNKILTVRKISSFTYTTLILLFHVPQFPKYHSFELIEVIFMGIFIRRKLILNIIFLSLNRERDAEFTEKRYQSAEELLGEIATDRPTTSRHEKLPPPSVLSARRGMASGASTNRSRNESRLPVPANKTLPSKSRSRSHSQVDVSSRSD